MHTKRHQEQFKWSKADYERVREKAIAQPLVKKRTCHDDSLRQVLTSVSASEVETSAISQIADTLGANEHAEDTHGTSLPRAANAREEIALQLHLEIKASCLSGRLANDEALVEFVLGARGEHQFNEFTASRYVDVDSFSSEVRLRIDGYETRSRAINSRAR